MKPEIIPGKSHPTWSDYTAIPSAMIYTDQILTCDSCREDFGNGFLVEMQGDGLYCFACFRPAFDGYFRKHPNEDYVLARGVWSLAHQGETERGSL